MDEVKTKIQEEALARWELAGRKGRLAIATGVGKSRIALMRVAELYEEYGENLRVLLAVPTIKLKTVDWPNEAKEWELLEVFNEQIEAYCWASMETKPSGHYHLVILDEAHHLTEKSYKFLEHTTYDEIMALTATEPEKGSDKEKLLDSIAPSVFSYSLDEAREDNVAADYDIYVIEMPLNSTAKIIPGGSAKKRFYVTEEAHYKYLHSWFIKNIMSDKENKDAITNMIFRKRTQFLYNLPSKQIIAKLVLNKIVGNDKTLVFGSTKKQIEALLGKDVYHSGTDTGALDRFTAGDLQTLGSIRALDEGGNFPGIDQIFIIQLTSKARQTVQRMGRVLRKRPGHRAKIYILVVTGTMDEEWSKSALAGIDPKKIFHLSYKNFIG